MQGTFFQVYKPTQVQKKVVVNGIQYSTVQAAYDAANAVATASNPVVMWVGAGTSTDFGGITLTADWNTDVIIVGYGKDVSKIGAISGDISADASSYQIIIKCSGLTIAGIHSKNLTSITAQGNGPVTIICYDPCVLGVVDTSPTQLVNVGNTSGAISITGFGTAFTTITTIAGNSAGAVTIGDGITGGDISASSSNTGDGGNVTIGKNSTVGNIITDSGSAGSPSKAGNILLDIGAIAGNLTARAMTGTGVFNGFITLRDGAKCGNIIVSKGNNQNNTGRLISLNNSIVGSLCLGGLDASIAPINAKYTKFQAPSGSGCIDFVGSGSNSFMNCVFVTSGANKDCISNLLFSGAQFYNCIFVPHGTGKSINASGPRTVLAYNVLHNNGFGSNVTKSEGDDTTVTGIITYPI